MNQNRIQKLLQQNSAYLITSPENLYYFSGFTGGEGALYIDQNTQKLFTDSRYTVQATEQAVGFEIVDIADTKLSDFLKTLPEIPIGFEDEYTTFSRFLSLKKNAPSITLVPASEQIRSIRMIKDFQELSFIETAAKIADDAFRYILPKIAPGKTEMEIALDLEFYMRKNGAEGLSFETISASGVRSAMPHGVASNKPIEKNDFFTLDFGCKYKGYCSDMTRTVVVGKACDKQKDVYETVLSAQLAALSAICPGSACKDVDAVARNRIKEAGYGAYFGHGLGHSVGLEIHEKPNLSPRSEDILSPGIPVTVEPGIYIAGFGGVRIEDLVVVTEDGYRNFVTAPKELLEL